MSTVSTIHETVHIQTGHIQTGDIQSGYIQTGDVVEFDHDGEFVTAMVLLAADDNVILDLCDGTIPLVFQTHELTDIRRFEPALVGLAA